MTRFNISLQGGVDMIIHALKNSWGGELFVPKIPSYKILMLLKQLGLKCLKNQLLELDLVKKYMRK